MTAVYLSVDFVLLRSHVLFCFSGTNLSALKWEEKILNSSLVNIRKRLTEGRQHSDVKLC